jgi:hypothetical protein
VGSGFGAGTTPDFRVSVGFPDPGCPGGAGGEELHAKSMNTNKKKPEHTSLMDSPIR